MASGPRPAAGPAAAPGDQQGDQRQRRRARRAMRARTAAVRGMASPRVTGPGRRGTCPRDRPSRSRPRAAGRGHGAAVAVGHDQAVAVDAVRQRQAGLVLAVPLARGPGACPGRRSGARPSRTCSRSRASTARGSALVRALSADSRDRRARRSARTPRGRPASWRRSRRSGSESPTRCVRPERLVGGGVVELVLRREAVAQAAAAAVGRVAAAQRRSRAGSSTRCRRGARVPSPVRRGRPRPPPGRARRTGSGPAAAAHHGRVGLVGVAQRQGRAAEVRRPRRRRAGRGVTSRRRRPRRRRSRRR